MELAQEKLTSVHARLNVLVARKQFAAATSFSTAEMPELPPLSVADELLLEELRQVEDGTAPVSFGIGEDIGTTLEKLRQMVRYYVAAETAQQDQVIGRTTFSWTGDTDTVWAFVSSKRQVKMHRRTVYLALASKDTNIRLLFLTVQAAAKIAASLSN